MQIRVVKSRADNPLTSLETAAAVAALTFGYQLIDKAQAKNFEDYVEETNESAQRETLWVFNDLSTANIAGENVALKDFISPVHGLEVVREPRRFTDCQPSALPRKRQPVAGALPRQQADDPHA
jgi:hypothetical protein